MDGTLVLTPFPQRCTIMHRLLKRQLDRYTAGSDSVPAELRQFIDSVNDAYHQSDADRDMLERSLELSSQELLQTNSELRAVVQAYPDLFFRLDYSGVVLEQKGGEVGDRYHEPRSLVGKRIQEALAPSVAGKLKRAVNEVAKTGRLVSVEYSLSGAAGVRYFEARLLPLYEDQLMVIVRNITDRKEVEIALATKAAELAASNAELEQFAYVASHDLQEPLRTVQSYLQLLARRYHDKLDDDAQEFIGYAVDGAKRMRGLINDLLTYARISSRAKPPELTELDVLVDEVLQGLRLAIEESGAEIVREPLPTAVVERTQLKMVFQNLITNALKFTRPDVPPRISISCAQQGSSFKVSVSDNGIGMEAEYTDKIFEIFRRLHTHDEYAGSGIGLAVCKKIVERHGGRIWVESRPEQGATFFFTLPGGKG